MGRVYPVTIHLANEGSISIEFRNRSCIAVQYLSTDNTSTCASGCIATFPDTTEQFSCFWVGNLVNGQWWPFRICKGRVDAS